MKKYTKLLILLLSMVIVVYGSACEKLPKRTPQDSNPTEDNTNKPVEDSLSGDTAPPAPENPQNQPSLDDSPAQENANTKKTYKIADSGFQITVESPLEAYKDPLMGSTMFYVADDQSFQGYMLYEKGNYPLEQLKQAMQSTSEATAADKTITNYKEEVTELENSMFSYLITYSAGDTSESSGGFSYILYRKVPEGLITITVNSPQVIYEEIILSMFTTLTEDDGSAQEVPEE